jgi:hypothetical protein
MDPCSFHLVPYFDGQNTKMETSVGCGMNYGFFKISEPGPSKNWDYLFCLILISLGVPHKSNFFFSCNEPI